MNSRIITIIALVALLVSSAFAADIQFFRDLNMNTSSVKNILLPLNPLDAANKAYVDSAARNVGFLSNLFWVAMNGNDAIADGSVARPFKTIQAAINRVAANGDNADGANPYTIRVAPGTYNETINLNSPNLKCLVIMGTPADIGADVIVNGIISTNANDALARLVVGGMTFGSAVFEGESEGSNLGGNDLVFYSCYIGGLVSMKNINCAGFVDCKLDGDMLFENALYPYINGGAGQNPGASLTFRFDASKKKPNYGSDVYATIERTVIAAPTIEKSGAGSLTVRMRLGTRAGHATSTLNVGVGTALILQGATVLGAVNKLGIVQNIADYYDNAASGLAATHLQSAVDELNVKIVNGGAAASNVFVRKTGDTMTGALALPGNPASALEAAPKQYVDTAKSDAIAAAATDASTKADAALAAAQASAALATNAVGQTWDARWVNSAGDTMAGDLNLAGNKVQNVGLLTADEIQAKTMTTVYQTNLSLVVTNLQLEGAIDMKNNRIRNLAAPVDGTDAATKAYADSVAGTNYHRNYWVSTYDGSDANNGSFLFPFKTLQKAVDTAPNDDDTVIYVMQTMTEPDLTIAKSRITIQGVGGFDSHATLLYSRVLIQGATTTRVRFKDIHIRTYGLAGGGVPLTIDGTKGSHKFDNTTLYPANGTNAFIITGSIPNNFWSEFIGSAIMGPMDLGGTLAGAASITFRQCSEYGMKISVNSPYAVFLVDIQRMGKLTHNAGVVVLRNVHSIEAQSGVCIESTATLAGGGALLMSAVNFQQVNLSYGRINKTGNGLWAIDNSNRDAANDVLAGARVNFSAIADDISARFTPVNYSAADSSVRSHLQGIDAALAGTLPVVSNQFVLKTGDTMTGNLTVPAPTAGGHATTKPYVDGADAAVVRAAATDASTKANAAQANAKAYTDDATNVLGGQITLQRAYNNGSQIQKAAGSDVVIKDNLGNVIAIF